MPARVLLADDHRVLRDGLKSLLPVGEFEVVGEAENGREAITLARKGQPDLALLDIGMPGLNGVDTTREVRRVSPATRVIVLTMHAEDAYVIEAVRAGARGYVLKTDAATELLDALRKVAGGGVYISSRVSHALVDGFSRRAELDTDRLSPREREVLQLVAEGHTTKSIAMELGISYKTAETHRLNLMSKLDIHEVAGLVRYAIRSRLISA